MVGFIFVRKTKQNNNYTEPILVLTTRWTHQYLHHKEGQQQQK